MERDDLTLEFCAENMTDVPAAIAAGARRIELCDNLARGGTSVSAGVAWACVSYAHAHGARVMAMVRPRGGDFAYTETEFAMMEADLTGFANLGVDGVVLGCLAADPQAPGAWALDLPALERLAGLARGLGVADLTFHMAFDELPAATQLPAIDVLAELGFTRILTHGGPAGTPIEGNLPRLRELAAHAAGKLTILPGAGITYRNAGAIARELWCRELHGTKIVDVSAGAPARGEE